MTRWLPEGLPHRAVVGDVEFVALSPALLDDDYAAVMRDIPMLRAWSNQDWPTLAFTTDRRLEDQRCQRCVVLGAGAFEAVLGAAKPLAEALYTLLAVGRRMTSPEERAGFRKRLSEASARIEDKALGAEYRRALLDRRLRHKRIRGAPGRRHGGPAAARSEGGESGDEEGGEGSEATCRHAQHYKSPRFGNATIRVRVGGETGTQSNISTTGCEGYHHLR